MHKFSKLFYLIRFARIPLRIQFYSPKSCSIRERRQAANALVLSNDVFSRVGRQLHACAFPSVCIAYDLKKKKNLNILFIVADFVFFFVAAKRLHWNQLQLFQLKLRRSFRTFRTVTVFCGNECRVIFRLIHISILCLPNGHTIDSKGKRKPFFVMVPHSNQPHRTHK